MYLTQKRTRIWCLLLLLTLLTACQPITPPAPVATTAEINGIQL
jgi:hypothetical protein